MFVRNKSKFPFFCSVLLLTSVQSCLIYDTCEVEYYSHGVERYYTISDIKADVDTVEVEGSAYYKLVIRTEQGDIISEEREKEFKALCEMHKDYGGEHYVQALCANRSFPDKDIKGIEVTTLDDWDKVHKAGSSINDLCHFVAFSFHPYILNGYEPVEKRGQSSSFSEFTREPNLLVGHSIPIDKPLSEITEEETVLIGGGWSCNLFALFIPIEDTDETRTLKVKLTDIAGTEFSADVVLK